MSSTPKRPAHRPSKGARAKHTLRLPVELDHALRQRAERHGRCLNDELVHILSAVLSSTPGRIAELYVAATGTPVRTTVGPMRYMHPENPA